MWLVGVGKESRCFTISAALLVARARSGVDHWLYLALPAHDARIAVASSSLAPIFFSSARQLYTTKEEEVVVAGGQVTLVLQSRQRLRDGWPCGRSTATSKGSVSSEVQRYPWSYVCTTVGRRRHAIRRMRAMGAIVLQQHNISPFSVRILQSGLVILTQTIHGTICIDHSFSPALTREVVAQTSQPALTLRSRREWVNPKPLTVAATLEPRDAIFRGRYGQSVSA